jgi:hypothetical protein
MSSEMRELVKELRAYDYTQGNPDSSDVGAWADRLERALLARTEAGEDGAEPFGWWIECHGTDGDFGQFVTDRAFVELLRSHGVVERETALFTHPQDASGDAEELLAADMELDAAEAAFDALDKRDGIGDDRDVRDYDGPEYARLSAAVSRRARAIAAMQAKEAK